MNDTTTDTLPPGVLRVTDALTALGHPHPPVMLIDERLFRFGEIWAAAGHPHGVFRLTPDDLKQLTSAPVHDVTVPAETHPCMNR